MSQELPICRNKKTHSSLAVRRSLAFNSDQSASVCRAGQTVCHLWSILQRRCPIIGSPQKSLPWPTIYPQKSPGGRILPANCRPGETYLESILQWENTSYGAGNILIRDKHISSVIIFPRADFSWGRHFNLTPASQGKARLRRYMCTCISSQIPRIVWPLYHSVVVNVHLGDALSCPVLPVT